MTCYIKYPCIGVVTFCVVLLVCDAMLETTITNKPFSAVLIAIYESYVRSIIETQNKQRNTFV